MSLHQLLLDHRSEILAQSEKRVIALAALRPSSDQLELGLPIFFDQLTLILAKKLSDVSTPDENEITLSAGEHGKELLRLGYTLSHVVHAYGAMCQAITEVASQRKAAVSALEFHNLNRCLDIAIAGAVTEFELIRNEDTKKLEVMHLGVVAHELRNALNRASVAFEMLSKGVVGLGGSTSRVLEYSLAEMEILIDRSLSEVRLRAETPLNFEIFTILGLLSQLVVTAEVEAGKKHLTVSTEIDPSVFVSADKHLLLAAIGNLVQNALKFTKPGGHVLIKSYATGDHAIISVQDQCGGIAPDKMKNLFRAFVKDGADKSGLGLGLIISREAIEKCGGTLDVHNSADGCVFEVKLPLQTNTNSSGIPPVL
jgi:signal transduction histidine kinase